MHTHVDPYSAAACILSNRKSSISAISVDPENYLYQCTAQLQTYPTARGCHEKTTCTSLEPKTFTSGPVSRFLILYELCSQLYCRITGTTRECVDTKWKYRIQSWFLYSCEVKQPKLLICVLVELPNYVELVCSDLGFRVDLVYRHLITMYYILSFVSGLPIWA